MRRKIPSARFPQSVRAMRVQNQSVESLLSIITEKVEHRRSVQAPPVIASARSRSRGTALIPAPAPAPPRSIPEPPPHLHEYLLAFVRDELDAADREIIEAHVTIC